MKILFLTLFLIASLFAGNAKDAAQLLGAENNYTSAIEKAKKENKVLVMVIVKEHCRWCDKLVNRTLADEKIQKPLEEFVMLVVDRNDVFPNQFKEDIFPSIFYIDAKSEKSVYSNVGYVGTKCFLNDLNSSLTTFHSLFENK